MTTYSGGYLRTNIRVVFECMCKAGDASFPAAAPDLWNRLPFSLRELCNENSFKNALKTLYFKQYFG